MGIVWIASYPKSGNTWLRFLLANYLAGPIDQSARVEELVPDLMRGTNLLPVLAARPAVYSKTHYLWSPLHPFAKHTDRAIVIVRHPKDVLLSNLNYRWLDRGINRGFTDEAYARHFITLGGEQSWIEGDIGTLEQNVESWMSSGLEQLIVRYEDLKTNTKRELARAIAFLGLETDASRVEMAVAHSGFDRMRALEVREKTGRNAQTVFPGAAPRRGWARYFMNEGKVRGSLKHLGQDLDDAFDRRFGPLMKTLGYAASA